MKSLEMKKTNSSPSLIFSTQEHYLKIEGNSYMDYTFEFYAPLFKNLKEYFQNDMPEQFIIDVSLNVLNSRSSMVLSELFDLCISAQNRGFDITVIWNYDTENDMALESGEDYKEEFSDLDFYLITFGLVA